MTKKIPKTTVWWNPRGLSYEQAEDDDNFEDEVRQVLNTEFHGHFLDVYIDDHGLAVDYVTNYDEIRSAFISLFDSVMITEHDLKDQNQKTISEKYKHLNIPFEEIELHMNYTFFDLMLIGGQGDLDDGMMMPTSPKDFANGRLCYEQYHSGNNLFDDSDDLGVALADYFYNKIIKIQKSLNHLLAQVRYRNSELQKHVSIETYIESDLSVIWRRWLVRKCQNNIFVDIYKKH